ncbi:MAG: hypothetical protein A2275_15700 [Bacteroidetes bacterium RIFOXYA12_FULL_35_11]|nr:MAG: hypothetical protein A2X01_21670 [Bacteroidetes bacterium GWF2_35_48]OFY79608.1 MAG: hypothetical protein A2275_15700 [Bacteroidetes bacterium RIFOXYA12_FULL_35_11]OFY94976.1 MAG: hypothetical protein A2309_09975 [Bacteroidetes bacterium RIFOXYB2_FULL_35_7]HBX50560.1 hypothetical protein [Bacteroidales bacterium]
MKCSKSNDFTIPVKNGLKKVCCHEILYCEADGKYTRVFYRSNSSVYLSICLKYVEANLPGTCFFRIHKSYLVNLNHIEVEKKGSKYFVSIKENKHLKVAVRNKKDFKKALTEKFNSLTSLTLIPKIATLTPLSAFYLVLCFCRCNFI